MSNTATTCRTIGARRSFIPLIVKKTDPGLGMKPGKASYPRRRKVEIQRFASEPRAGCWLGWNKAHAGISRCSKEQIPHWASRNPSAVLTATRTPCGTATSLRWKSSGCIGVKLLAVRLNAQSLGTPTKAEAAKTKLPPIARDHQARLSRAHARSNAFVSAIRI